jgi:hypothetical protein
MGCATPTIFNQRSTCLAVVPPGRDESGSPMRFYTKKHKYYRGIGLHAVVALLREFICLADPRPPWRAVALAKAADP